MALRPGVNWSDGRSEARSGVGRSRNGSQGGQNQAARSGQFPANRPPTLESRAPASGVAATPAPKRDRTWLYAVVGVVLAIGGGGAWMVTRHQPLGAPPATIAAPVTPEGVAPIETARPAAATVTPVGPAPPVGPVAAPIPAPTAEATATAAATEKPGPGPEAAPWKPLSRGGKTKATPAHRRRAAAATADDDGGKSAPAAVEPSKEDPFAD
jgi:hypothetical protein